jgi:hypothetical protein
MWELGFFLASLAAAAAAALVTCIKSSVSDPDSGQWIRIRIQEGKNDPQSRKKLRNCMF